MVKVIIIRTSGDLTHCLATLDRIKKKLPQMTRAGMMRWGRILARDMKRSARAAGIQDFMGTLQDRGIRWEQGKRSDIGYLFIRLYGIYLDAMPPHFVNVHLRRTRLLMWARSAQNARIRQKASMLEYREIRRFSLFVRPKPFIRQGYQIARPKLRPILKQEAERAIHAS